MNKYIKLFCTALASAFLLSSCIEEVLPEDNRATSEQIGSSADALGAALNGIPSQLSQGYYVYGTQNDETDMGLVSFQISMTEMLGDMYVGISDNAGYDWFSYYNSGLGGFAEEQIYAYLPFFTLYRLVKATNDVIGSVDINDESVSLDVKGMAAVAYTIRAYMYYNMMVLYEPVENIYTDVSAVKGLTVPIVTDQTDPESSKNNPRATHDEMMTFILSDLDIAEKYLANYTPSSKLFPDLSVVYAIKAKAYMWDKDYENAATYARKAIDESGATPVTQAQWLDLTTGFNTENQAWMWKMNYSAENMGNLCNFTGWMSAEAEWGYSSLTKPCIDRSLYDKIAVSDFRKYSFLDPAKYDFYDYKTVRDAEWVEKAPSYLGLKFRCREGDFETYSIGGCVDVPLMRVEEMYLLEAEAIGMSQGVGAGVAKLNSFMQNYRQSDYNCTAADEREFQIEVLTQSRIEFWGEGLASFPNAKRIQPDIIQNYEGTNAPTDALKINCKGIKPHWNLVIPISEVNANQALVGKNNPNPNAAVVGPIAIGTFAPGNNTPSSDNQE